MTLIGFLAFCSGMATSSICPAILTNGLAVLLPTIVTIAAAVSARTMVAVGVARGGLIVEEEFSHELLHLCHHGLLPSLNILFPLLAIVGHYCEWICKHRLVGRNWRKVNGRWRCSDCTIRGRLGVKGRRV